MVCVCVCVGLSTVVRPTVVSVFSTWPTSTTDLQSTVDWHSTTIASQHDDEHCHATVVTSNHTPTHSLSLWLTDATNTSTLARALGQGGMCQGSPKEGSHWKNVVSLMFKYATCIYIKSITHEIFIPDVFSYVYSTITVVGGTDRQTSNWWGGAWPLTFP